MGKCFIEYFDDEILFKDLNFECRLCQNVITNVEYKHVVRTINLYCFQHAINVITQNDNTVECKICGNLLGTYYNKTNTYILSRDALL